MRLMERAPDSWGRHRKSAIWIQEPLKMNEGFETKFSFRISDPGLCSSLDGFCGGGDGFAMVIKVGNASLTSSVPGTHIDPSEDEEDVGRNLGYAGITNSIALEFDTWFTKEFYDPKQVH